MGICTPAWTLILHLYTLKTILQVWNCLCVNYCFLLNIGSNYKTPTATKTETFEKLPRMLNFHLQRVNYDVQRKEAVKLNNQFAFEKVIYLDRYMHRNEREVLRRRESVVKLQEQVRAMEEEVERYEAKNCGLSIRDQIDNVSEFFRSFSHHNITSYEEVCGSLASLRDQVSLRIEGIHLITSSFLLHSYLILMQKFGCKLLRKRKRWQMCLLI